MVQDGRGTDGRAVIGRDDVVVTGKPERPAELESPKATSVLLNTPQTITVISDQTLRKQNLQTLRDALQTIPGITFGAGEGGNPTGDRPFIRGFDSQSNVFVDGLRDVGCTATLREVRHSGTLDLHLVD